MKPILRIVLIAAAGLLILPNPGTAEPGNYFIGGDSLSALEQARAADPNNYAVNYFLGQIYLAAGNRDAAIDAWDAYLAAAPADGRSVAVRERMTLLKQAQAREFAKKAVAQGRAAPTRAPANTIAVTDFKNLGPAKLVPFIKGLTAMIISDLAKVPQVRVLERAKIQALVQEMQLGMASGIVDATTAPKLGQMVQAAKVAWGRMDAPDGDNLKITSIVTEIMENTNLKETDAAGAMAEFFKLQKQLVFGILEGMNIDRADLPDNVRKAVEKVHTTSVDALIQFGMGLGFLDNQHFGQAKQAFAKALKIDPGFDLAGDAEAATPISDVPLTSDGATEEVSASTAGSGETTDEGSTGETTPDEGTGDDTLTASAGDTPPSPAETTTTDTTTVADTTTDTTQTTTTDATATATSDDYGFAVAMVDYWTGAGSGLGSESYAGTYRTTSVQDGNSSAIATQQFTGGGSATYDGPNDRVTALNVGGTQVNDSGIPYQSKSVDIGSDTYMGWGRFNAQNPTTTPPMVEGSINHSIDTDGYYVGGTLTTIDQMSALASGMWSASYTGNAYGTLWNNNGGVDMTGIFSMDVSFDAGVISNFVWSVNDGGTNDAYISGASGSITNNHFSIDPSTGAKAINGTAVLSTAAEGLGAFYGTDAAKAGGIVVLDTTGPAQHVVGMYEGSRGALAP